MAGAWRHLLRRVKLAYEPGLWSVVFPVGISEVASHELGSTLSAYWLVMLGRYEAWLALAVWAIVFLAWRARCCGRPGCRTRLHPPAGKPCPRSCLQARVQSPTPAALRTRPVQSVRPGRNTGDR